MTHLDQSGINLIQYLFYLEQSGIDLIQFFSSGSNRKRYHSISFHVDQSGIDRIQSIFFWIKPESISSNICSFGTIRNRSCPRSIRNRSHPISSHLEQSGIDLIQYLSFRKFLFMKQWNRSHPTGSNRNRSHLISFPSGSISANTNQRGLM
ncbi:hypothetical protein CEXT_802151 [Caerostris extrusa]|uniref:Maturase K n=1 Tax=Caerostris extrusa TaxID=172846 RepID=A0AAV4T9D9_CAEEX|nr:hypothetical protein CEXT_802151 [Caerostris extrusa]